MRVLRLSPSSVTTLDSVVGIEGYLDELTDIVTAGLRVNEDRSLVGVWHMGEIGMEGERFDQEFGDKRVVFLREVSAVRRAVRNASDPVVQFSMWIRSMQWCRSALFAHDGLVFLCLSTDDSIPRTTPIVQVEECSQILVETDYFDG